MAASFGPNEFNLPSGTTAERPSNAPAGSLRWNTTDSALEIYTGSSWLSLNTSAAAGIHYYNVSNTTAGIDYYRLPAPFDLDNKGSSLFNLLSGTRIDCVDVSNDGKKFFALGDGAAEADVIREYYLSVPFDLSTASLVTTHALWYDGAPPISLEFALEGTRLYTTEGNAMKQYDLSNAYDITSMNTTASGTLTDGWASYGPGEPAFNPTGTLMTVGARSSDIIKTFSLSTPFDISTATKIAEFDALAATTNQDPSCCKWNGDGTTLYVRHSSPDMVNEFSTTTAYSVSGMSFVKQVYDNAGFAGGGHEFNYNY